MQILLSYDVSGKNNEVKELLLELGYSETIEGDNGISILPASTLYFETEEKGFSANDVLDDIESIATELNVILEKAISVEFDNWYSIKGASKRRLK